MMDWNDSYSVGNEHIDFQHRNFLNLLNEFGKAKTANSGNQHLCRILHQVIKFAEYHFMREENLMTISNYPDLERHKMIHSHLLSQAKTKAHELELGICGSQEVLDFLNEWFVLHITDEDKDVGKYFNAHQSI